MDLQQGLSYGFMSSDSCIDPMHSGTRSDSWLVRFQVPEISDFRIHGSGQRIVTNGGVGGAIADHESGNLKKRKVAENFLICTRRVLRNHVRVHGCETVMVHRHGYRL